jgi:hypothetical protein
MTMRINMAGIRQRWLEGGAGDGNRKYRWRAPTYWNHDVANGQSSACDYCVKNLSYQPTPADANNGNERQSALNTRWRSATTLNSVLNLQS